MTPSDTTGVAVADVYKAGRRAAQLRRHPDHTEFAYLPDYLADPGPPVATSLPCSVEPVRTTGGAIPPFFAGLLPEGRRLSRLRRAVKTSSDDELSLLLVVGTDPVGDVQVLPEGAEPRREDPLVVIDRPWSEIDLTSVFVDSGVLDPVALPGVQDKVSARMISVPVARAGERFIVKVDPPEYRFVVENEAFFLHRARGTGLRVTKADLVTDATGRRALVVQRFDRRSTSDGRTEALACEDACQVLGRWPADKYAVTAEAVVQALADQCDAQAVARRDLFAQLCFAWLTANGDLHAKNVSIVAEPDGEWRVSPAYDLPSTAPYGDKSLALAMGGRKTGLSRKALLEFAATIGLREAAARRALDDQLERLTDLIDEVRGGALPYDANTTIELVKELRHRRRSVA